MAVLKLGGAAACCGACASVKAGRKPSPLPLVQQDLE